MTWVKHTHHWVFEHRRWGARVMRCTRCNIETPSPLTWLNLEDRANA